MEAALIPFITATLVAAISTPFIISLYKRFNWIDDPETKLHVKHTHTRPVTRGGGLVIFIALIFSSLVFLHFDSYLVAILSAALLLTITGFLDDICDLHPIPRLLVNIFAALIVVGSGIGIAYVTNPFGPGVIHLDQPQLTFTLFGTSRSIWIIADLFALLFIVWNMNIVNWSKGVDGQLPGFVTAAMIFIGLLSTRFADDPTTFNTTILAFIVGGSFFGLLFWNWYPQKIMPGYGAGSLAGFFISVLAILSGAKVATLMMILAIPTADAVFTIARRLRAGKSPFWGDRGHLHHKLHDVLKWGKRRIALFYWVSSMVLGVLSLYLNTVGKLLTIATVTALVFGFLIWARYARKVD